VDLVSGRHEVTRVGVAGQLTTLHVIHLFRGRGLSDAIESAIRPMPGIGCDMRLRLDSITVKVEPWWIGP